MPSAPWYQNGLQCLAWLLGLLLGITLVLPALAADVVPPRPLPNAPTGGTLTIGHLRETSSPDGFQAVGTFDRMYFFTGNEVLVAMGKDGLYDPAESLAYAYEVLDDGKRYRFHMRKGVEFYGGLGEMTAHDAAWSLNRIHQIDVLPRLKSRDSLESVSSSSPGNR